MVRLCDWSKQVVFSFFHCHGLFCALGSVFSWPGPTGWPRPEGEEGVSDSRYETLCWHLSNNDKKVFYKLRKKSPGFDKVQLSFKSAMLCLVAKVTIKLVCLNWGWHDKLIGHYPFARWIRYPLNQCDQEGFSLGELANSGCIKFNSEQNLMQPICRDNVVIETFISNNPERKAYLHVHVGGGVLYQTWLKVLFD